MDIKLTKVVFEYEDGTTKWIDGKTLREWELMNAHVAQMADIHGFNPDWERIKWNTNEIQGHSKMD